MYASIKEYNPEVHDQIEKLNSFQKKVFVASVVGRCRKLVASFDEDYDENRSDIFNEAVQTALENLLPVEKKIESADKILASLKKNVPDTEEFGDIEGTVAQNSFLAAIYAYGFFKDGKTESFNYCLDKVLENIDAINYDRNEEYDEKEVFTKESHVIKEQIQIIKSTDKNELYARVTEFIEENQISLL